MPTRFPSESVEAPLPALTAPRPSAGCDTMNQMSVATFDTRVAVFQDETDRRCRLWENRLMKHLLVAVAFFALPAAALAQSVSCQTCDHVVSYFRGEGGFIATVAEGVDEVVFVAFCGNVTTTGEVKTGGGTVAQLFTYRNGLACDEDDGSLEIAGVTDGGWFWITDDMSSAVGNLVAKDLFDAKGMALGDTVEITSAGDGVTMMAGKGAVYLKETASGRVGILPNILPEPPMDPASVCGPRQSDT